MAKRVTPKRQRVDSIAGSAKAMQAALMPDIEPPAHIRLPKHALPFWKSIVDGRAKQLWNAPDLEMAANLAITKADIAKLQNQICREGYLINSDKGKVENPKHAIVETLSRRAIALSRMLHIHAEATIGRSADSTKARQKEKEAAEALRAAAPRPALTRADLIPMRPLN